MSLDVALAGDPCWFSLYVHLAKTGGSFDFNKLPGFNPTRKVMVMRDKQLVELTTGPLPSPLDATNRRLAVVIHGDVHHDGCLQHNWTLPWARRVQATYMREGCPGLIWTIVRDPAAHYISLFRWFNFGFRQRDMRQYLATWAKSKRLLLWASTTFAKRGLALSMEDKRYLSHVQALVEDARHNRTDRAWDDLSIADRYAVFTVMLARPRFSRRPFAFQSSRLLPIWTAFSDSVRDLPAYVEKACPPVLRSRAQLEERFVVSSLRQGFDLVGLTELRAAVLVRVAQDLRIPVPDDSPLYRSDCTNRDNPARDIVYAAADAVAAASDEEEPKAWTKAALPPFLAKVLPIVLNEEMRFYRIVRDQFWCKLFGVRYTANKVEAACPHPWEFETHKCAVG